MGFIDAIIAIITCADAVANNPLDDLRPSQIKNDIKNFPWKWFFGVFGAAAIAAVIAYFAFRP